MGANTNPDTSDAKDSLAALAAKYGGKVTKEAAQDYPMVVGQRED